MISSKISQTIGYINCIKKFLQNSALILLYNSLILSYFDYCCTIWGTSADCNISKLQKMQNRYARMVLQANIRTSHKLMLSQLGWQSIKQRINYQFNLFTFKIISDLAPRYLKQLIFARYIPHWYVQEIYPLWQETPYLYTLKPLELNITTGPIMCMHQKLWNQLPVEVQTISSFRHI